MRPRKPRPDRAARAVLLALALTLGGVSVAEAYRFAGERWPNRTISVASEAPRYEAAVRAAIRAWNGARVGVRFVRAPAQIARVLFRYSRGGGGRFGCEGIAGATGGGYPTPFVQPMEVRVIRGCRNAQLRRLTAAHELGHVLGLAHEDRRCALMNSSGSLVTLLPSRCAPGGPASRRLVLADDKAGARRLYRRPSSRTYDVAAQFNPGSGSRYPFGTGQVQFGASNRQAALDYVWDFGDPLSGVANAARGLDAPHTFSAPGAYTVTLTVLDGGTPVATARQQIELF